MLELRSAMLALADARKLKELTNTDGKYTVATDGEFGIGIRETPEVDGMRTGEDLLNGAVFEVTEIIEKEGQPTFLKLADGRGWVFDASPAEPDKKIVRKLADDERFENLEEVIEGLEMQVAQAKSFLAQVKGARTATAEEAAEQDKEYKKVLGEED